MSGDPAAPQPELAAGGAPRWGVSSLDWQSHAIDEGAEHSDGVYVARCGQRVFMGASLYDEAPGWMCLSCLRWAERGDTGEVTEPSPARPEREEGGAQ
ncbi:MAG: hypothetical protein JO063_10245 [Pseudonocardiales bacterium]|nr:hypothetical protein [Pseudonocardiales bacterium]MBV9032051.1 hypothetical protein [Pseudonocardiales bacterium]MBW0010478.1 hypothetical protein [Pseudonocardiales bacterium]